ncbi:craniofacial development protein 2 [Biomphalaria glabrata]|nr:GRIP and coiled-coil domain-containing protein 2-like [Biomphalaria glabrata]
MSAAQIRRRKLKKENPEKYAELLAKERAATKKYKLKKKEQWEEGNHSQAEIEEYNAKKEKERLYARDYYWKIKTQKSCQTRNSVRTTPTTSKSEHEKKRPKDMSPNELRKYRSSQRKAQIAALSHQKKAALRLKDRERKRKMREAAMLARISSRLAQPSDRVGRLKQSAYNLNNELKPKTKKYTQTALNPLNPGTPEKKQTTRKREKKQPCRSRFKTKKSDSPDIKEELGLQLEDTFLEEPEQEDISKPVYNTLQETDNLDIKEELDIQLQDFLLKEPHQEEQNFKPIHNIMQKLQASLDVVQDEAEKAKEDRKQANKDIEQLVTQLADLKGQLASSKEERESLLRQIDTLKADLKGRDGSCDELRTKLKASETELYVVRLQLEDINKEKQTLEHKMAEAEAKWKSSEEDYKSQITKLEVCMKDLQEQLMSARQSMKQNSMLDLEMADYERTLSTLHNQVEERDRKIEELKAELDKLDQRITLMQTQISASEEQRVQADARANKLKSLLVKTKKELSDARQQETTQKSSELQLKAQLEEMIQQNEELKVQISDLTVESQKLQDKVKGQNENSARTVKSLESKVDSLTEELQMTRRELEIIQADYDNYKVRAHNVLKQQKARSPSDATVEVDKQERARYENAIDQLKGKLQEAYDKLELSRKDLELLQNEHDHLAQRHSKLISDLEDKETHFKSRLEELQKDKNSSVNELMEKITSLEVQKTFLSQKHKEHIVRLKDDHESAIELLQKQMEVSEMDNIRLQREIQSLQRSLKNREEAGGEHSSPHDFHPITVHPGEERQEGEGSEVVDTEPVRLLKPSAQPPAFTFEQLIATPMNELPGMKSPPPQVDEETLKMNLSVSQKKIEHLTELLSESEASVSMLTEQARILKEEIRRLERNIERERETQNMEYLKNIFLQFVCPKVGEQRQQLVPVLATMLKLSPEEKARIVAVAQSDEGGQQGAQGAGWGAYLHRWSGLT